MTELLVRGGTVVTARDTQPADVLVRGDQRAVARPQRRGVRSAGGVERGLIGAERLHRLGDPRGRQWRSRRERREGLDEIVDGGASADAAGGIGDAAAAADVQPLPVDPRAGRRRYFDHVSVAFLSGAATVVHDRGVLGGVDDPLAIQVSERELVIVSGRPNDHRDGFSRQSDLQWFLDGHEVAGDVGFASAEDRNAGDPRVERRRARRRFGGRLHRSIFSGAGAGCTAARQRRRLALKTERRRRDRASRRQNRAIGNFVG
jgi:hypothetical protein